MTPEVENRLEAFFSAFAHGARPLLLLDYDGTLAPFRVNRYEALPFAGVRDLLTRIQRQGQTRMAVITGRPASEIAPLLRLDTALEVWGLHGAERLYPDGHSEMERPAPEAQRRLDELRQRLQRDSFGGLFEDKPNACVMHWRGVPPHKARVIEKKTRELFEPLAQMDGLGLLEFEAGVELRAGRDKGGAVETILSEMSQAGRKQVGRAQVGPAAYLGDDLTDESAFRALNGLDEAHLSVLMRHTPRDTGADVWLRPPADLRAFLSMWLRATEEATAVHQLRQEEELATV